MDLRSVTGSTGHGPISDVRNPDLRDFLGNAGNSPLMSVSSRINLNTNENTYDDTHKDE